MPSHSFLGEIETTIIPRSRSAYLISNTRNGGQTLAEGHRQRRRGATRKPEGLSMASGVDRNERLLCINQIGSKDGFGQRPNAFEAGAKRRHVSQRRTHQLGEQRERIIHSSACVITGKNL